MTHNGYNEHVRKTPLMPFTSRLAITKQSSSQLLPTPVDLGILEPQAQVIHLQTSNTNTICDMREIDNEDEGEEIRPIPLVTDNLDLQIQNAVSLDHTYSLLSITTVTTPKEILSHKEEQQTIPTANKMQIDYEGATCISNRNISPVRNQETVMSDNVGPTVTRNCK